MENPQMNQPMLVVGEHNQSRIAGILRRVVQVPRNKRKSMASNTLLMFLPFCVLILGADLTFVPAMANIVTSMELFAKEDPNSLEIKEMVEGVLKGVWLLLGLEVFFLAISCIVSLFSLVLVVYTSSTSPSQKRLNVKELFLKTGRCWMRQVITWIYITFILFASIALGLASIGVVSVTSTGVALVVLCIMFVVLGTVCYVYFAAVWMFSMVMSITDMDLNEIMVHQKFEELIKGRRLQGFVILMFSSIISIVIALGFGLETRRTDRGNGTRSADGIMMLCYVSLLKLFMCMLYSVSYYESKSRNGEHFEVEERLDYIPIVVT